MSVGQELAVAVHPLLPLRIREVDFQDPILIVIGDQWSLSLLGAWEWRRADAVVTDWRDDLAEDTVWDLCGLALREVTSMNAEPHATTFGLSDGSALVTQPDGTTYEPWTFRHHDLPLVYVGEA